MGDGCDAADDDAPDTGTIERLEEPSEIGHGRLIG
jgi:hypothetical protein